MSHQEPILALLRAFPKVREGRWLQGAPSHVLAELLHQLEEDGWELRPKAETRKERMGLLWQQTSDASAYPKSGPIFIVARTRVIARNALDFLLWNIPPPERSRDVILISTESSRDVDKIRGHRVRPSDVYFVETRDQQHHWSAGAYAHRVRLALSYATKPGKPYEVWNTVTMP